MIMLLFILCMVFLSPMMMQAQQGGRNSHLFIPKLKKATLLVEMYEEENGYDEAVQKVITESWTFTPYKFVTRDELER